MKRFALVAALMMTAAVHAQEPKKRDCKTCGQEKFGTSIQWKGSPNEAAAEAKKQEKLLFILHVSGNFEDPKFT